MGATVFGLLVLSWIITYNLSYKSWGETSEKIAIHYPEGD